MNMLRICCISTTNYLIHSTIAYIILCQEGQTNLLTDENILANEYQ